ncbi:MAG: hypothetical protein ACJATA_002091 [Sphingobacteriales bacterium]|jgi:hypothetical protein
MDYNTTRPRLIFSEYGRNIQEMVNHINTLETMEDRTQLANIIVDMMAQFYPQMKDLADFKLKIWDHLYIMADFNLNVDAPYPPPSRESLEKKPNIVPYPSNDIKFKHYGKNVELMIAEAKLIEEQDKKEAYLKAIANFMKMAYVTWNQDSVNDSLIYRDLTTLMGEPLTIDTTVELTSVDLRKSPKRQQGGAKRSYSSTNRSKGGKKPYKRN